ncbi:MAG: PilZ domain-containing protein [Thermodesulfobacteriota bacterium]
MMNNKSNRRNFTRFPIEFVLEVSAKDIGGNNYKEKTILKDISGGGAKFMSLQAGKYFLGQPLEITIYLPEANGIKARMKGKATVVRIDMPGNSDISDRSQEIEIAVRIDTLLDFERLDVET